MKPKFSDSTRLILAHAFGVSPPDRTLIVFSCAGLNNRLRVLTSGLALAEATGRAFAMLWPRTPNCGATFAMLFQNHWPIVSLPAVPAELQSFQITSWSDKRLQQLLDDSHQHIILGHYNWFVKPKGKKAYASLQRRCLQLVTELQPIASLATRIESFRTQHFFPTMVGVHLRRGDFNRCRPYYSQNTSTAFKAVDRFLEHEPQAGILLCTDDGAVDPFTGKPTTVEGVNAAFEKRYGKRVVWSTQRSLDRQTPEAIQDAVVDLWLLRSTNYFVGTYGSSFSGMVMQGRSVPHILCATQTAVDERLERIINLIGLGHLVRLAVRWRFGRDLPFTLAWRWFIRLPLAPVRLLCRLLN